MPPQTSSSGGTNPGRWGVALPDADAVGRREVERLTRFHPEGVVPGVDVTHGQGAVVGRRVRVDHQTLAQRGLADFLTPGLGEAEEELLIPAQPIDDRRLLAPEREAISVVRRSEPSQVGDVLADRQLTVDRDVRKGTVSVVLLGKLRRRVL